MTNKITRAAILSALKSGEAMTTQDIADICGDTDLRRVRDNVSKAALDGLLDRIRDDVTGQPAYRLSKAGKARVAANQFNIGKGFGKTKQIAPEIPVNESRTENTPMQPSDPALLAHANRMLHDRLEGVVHVLRGCGLEGLKDCQAGDDLQMKCAALAGAYQMAISETNKDLDSMASLIAENAALRKQIADAQTEFELCKTHKQVQWPGKGQDNQGGYIVLPDSDEMRFFGTIDEARNHAEKCLLGDAENNEEAFAERFVLCAIKAYAEIKVTWEPA